MKKLKYLSTLIIAACAIIAAWLVWNYYTQSPWTRDGKIRAEQVGITPANIAVLKNGRAKAIRFSTLAAMCEVLGCQPGDLLEWVPDAPCG